MSAKSIILSSAGLKNVFPNQNSGDQFEFIFGNNKLVTSFLFADFISPVVSKMHKSDPTIDYIDFTNQIKDLTFTDEVLSLIQLLSKGSTIEIDPTQTNQINQLQILSLLLDNEELFIKLNNDFELSIDERNVDECIATLKFYSQISSRFWAIDYSRIIKHIASHFYSIESSKLLSLPLKILHAIVASDDLVIESEDSLFEFIEKLFEYRSNRIQNDADDDDEGIDIVSFYEEVEFTRMSDSKFIEFTENFSGSEMTGRLWGRLIGCFSANAKKRNKEELNEKRYKFKGKKIEYDGDTSRSLEGVIDYLTKKSGGIVSENGTVNVSSSSYVGSSRLPKNAADLKNTQSYFQSKNESDGWLQYDFVKNRVIPTSYTIRTRHDCDYNHPRNWVVEGSDTGKENEWTILDRRQNDASLSGTSVSRTFNIQFPQGSEGGYRYLRIRQTGTESYGYYYLTISALEYFGTLIEQ